MPEAQGEQALCHAIVVNAIIAWNTVYTQRVLDELGGDYYQCRDPERLTKRLVFRLQSLGHKVTLEPLPQAA